MSKNEQSKSPENTQNRLIRPLYILLTLVIGYVLLINVLEIPSPEAAIFWLLVWFSVPSLWIFSDRLKNFGLKLLLRIFLVTGAIFSVLLFFFTCAGIGFIGCL